MRRLFVAALLSLLILQTAHSQVTSRSEFSARYVSRAEAAKDFKELPWGISLEGLALSISVNEKVASSPRDVKLVLRNVTDHDLTINLGQMFNGDEQRPSSLSFLLNLVDAQGHARKVRFFSRQGFAAGRIDPYIIHLTTGSPYALTIRLNRFLCLETREWGISLAPGKNQLTAQFEGQKPGLVNLDQPEINSLNFWLGKLQSNTITVEN